MTFNTNDHIEEYHNSDELGEDGLNNAMQIVLGKINALSNTEMEAILFIGLVKEKAIKPGEPNLVVGMAGKAENLEKCIEAGIDRFIRSMQTANKMDDAAMELLRKSKDNS